MSSLANPFPVQYNIPRSAHDAVIAITPGKKAPTVSPLDDNDWMAVSVMVEKKKLLNVMDALEKVGATDILVLNIQNCRV